jgi:hypothetical membrane protein
MAASNMDGHTAASDGQAPGTRTNHERRVTRALLTGGVVAGPLGVGVVLVQMLIRPGFDIRHHAVSVLSNGDLGWLQVTNFIVAGLLVVAGALGLRRALQRGRAGTWGPLLVGVYGLGLIGAGLFSADPVPGFPPGTTATPTQLSSHGALHLLFSSVAFLSLIVASAIVFARRFAALRERSWAAYSVATGAFFFITWIGLILGQGSVVALNLAFACAVVLAWTWLSLVAARFRS